MMTAQVSPGVIETNLRTLAQTKRIRVTEFFQDFDKLRSGYITGNIHLFWLDGSQMNSHQVDAYTIGLHLFPLFITMHSTRCSK